MTNPNYLDKLNDYQKEAVVSDAKYLQILAGPGSGKTRALTTRVAWMVKENNVDPSSLVVVTFTNKAANEMKQRLEQPSLLGQEQSNPLSLGTFHALCAQLLYHHVDLTLLERNFVIADADRTKQLVKMVVKDLQPSLSNSGQRKKPETFCQSIRKAKNEGLDPLAYIAQCGSDPLTRDTAMIYSAYEERLLAANMTDFDGLLLHGRNLLKDHPDVVDHVEHVLVDEFQDTNSLQYELVWLLTHGGDKSLTVVGDPDQSIFGWRYANKGHFEKMKADYENTVVVHLKENYRSTKSILAGAGHVVAKDPKRLSRDLFTNNPDGCGISVLKAKSEVHEAELVTKEIGRILEFSNGLVKFKDIAILFRTTALTFNFERALGRANIPFVVVSGSRFLDRLEVKDLLAYLQFFYNPRDITSFARLINVPKRGLGEVSIKKIQVMATQQKWTLLATLQHIVDAHPVTKNMRIMSKSVTELVSLLALHKKVQGMMDEKVQTGAILQTIAHSIGYQDYLEINHEEDHETRWANVEELFTFAHRQDSLLVEDESGIEAVGHFLERATLCGDSKEHDEAEDGRVSLVTMHAAKGLEWTCVFVVGCEEGILPLPWTTDLEEESRVLYVAMTRAKCFLYCTHSAQRRRWNTLEKNLITRYLYDLPTAHCQKHTPAWNANVRKWVAQVLQKPYEENDLLLEDDGSGFLSNDDKIFAEIVDQITVDLQKKLLY